jgi:deoxyribodipyrimidine photolyase-related protein
MKPPCRHLLLVLGDQLDIDSSVFNGLDTERDAVLMIEAFEESTHVWSHKARTALFLSAMRHFADQLRQGGITVHYRALEHEGDLSLAAGLRAAALDASSPREQRAEQIRRLRSGELQILFAVDLFNEGLDIPEIDTVLFLRPTESAIVFLQQL